MYSEFIPSQPELVLQALAATDSTVDSVAAAFQTTPFALAHWLALPETQAMVAAFETAAACHARLQCAAALSSGFASVHRILADAAAPHSITLRAASLLLRLCNLHAANTKSARGAPRANHPDPSPAPSTAPSIPPSSHSTPPSAQSPPPPFHLPIDLSLLSPAFMHAPSAPARLLEAASRPPP